ncbi:hypothetical protein C3R44_21260, partial [Mycobacterium tuberculosis]
ERAGHAAEAARANAARRARPRRTGARPGRAKQRGGRAAGRGETGRRAGRTGRRGGKPEGDRGGRRRGG